MATVRRLVRSMPRRLQDVIIIAKTRTIPATDLNKNCLVRILPSFDCFYQSPRKFDFVVNTNKIIQNTSNLF